MSWESTLFALFEDLEQRADGLLRSGRDAEVGELARAEYSELPLAARVHASVGLPLQAALLGGATVHGDLRRAGRDWFLLQERASVRQEVLVALPAVTALRGLSSRAVPESARPLRSRLGLGSVLRALAEDGDQLGVVATDGGRSHGIIHRVGADFVELTGESGLVVVPLSAVALVRR